MYIFVYLCIIHVCIHIIYTIISGGQVYSTGGEALALLMADPASLSNTTYDHLNIGRSNL